MSSAYNSFYNLLSSVRSIIADSCDTAEIKNCATEISTIDVPMVDRRAMHFRYSSIGLLQKSTTWHVRYHLCFFIAPSHCGIALNYSTGYRNYLARAYEREREKESANLQHPRHFTYIASLLSKCLFALVPLIFISNEIYERSRGIFTSAREYFDMFYLINVTPYIRICIGGILALVKRALW